MTRLADLAGRGLATMLLLILACVPAGVLILGLLAWRRAQRR